MELQSFLCRVGQTEVCCSPRLLPGPAIIPQPCLQQTAAPKTSWQAAQQFCLQHLMLQSALPLLQQEMRLCWNLWQWRGRHQSWEQPLQMHP